MNLEFKESKAIFHRLGVQSLPWIVHVNPNVPVGADGVIKFKQEDVVSALLDEHKLYTATDTRRQCLWQTS